MMIREKAISCKSKRLQGDGFFIFEVWKQRVWTTEIYERTDTETKRKAIENAYPDLVNINLPDWNKDQALIAWLSELK